MRHASGPFSCGPRMPRNAEPARCAGARSPRPLLLDPIGLVAAQAYLVERRERRLEAVQVLDLALGFANRFREAGNMGLETCAVRPHLVRCVVLAIRLQALDACRK